MVFYPPSQCAVLCELLCSLSLIFSISVFVGYRYFLIKRRRRQKRRVDVPSPLTRSLIHELPTYLTSIGCVFNHASRIASCHLCFHPPRAMALSSCWWVRWGFTFAWVLAVVGSVKEEGERGQGGEGRNERRWSWFIMHVVILTMQGTGRRSVCHD